MYSTAFCCLLVVLLVCLALLRNRCYSFHGTNERSNSGLIRNKAKKKKTVKPVNYITPFPRNVSLGRLCLL